MTGVCGVYVELQLVVDAVWQHGLLLHVAAGGIYRHHYDALSLATVP